jgi:hypothetical protein
MIVQRRKQFGAPLLAVLVQPVDIGDADVARGGFVDGGVRGADDRQPYGIPVEEDEPHFVLSDVDLEIEDVTEEPDCGLQVRDLEIGPAAEELAHGAPD